MGHTLSSRLTGCFISFIDKGAGPLNNSRTPNPETWAITKDGSLAPNTCVVKACNSVDENQPKWKIENCQEHQSSLCLWCVLHFIAIHQNCSSPLHKLSHWPTLWPTNHLGTPIYPLKTSLDVMIVKDFSSFPIITCNWPWKCTKFV